MTRSELRRAAAIITAVGAASIAACASRADLRLNVVFEGAAQSSATWVEVAVLPGSCPDRTQLQAGLPPSGSVARVSFRTSDGASPPVGAIARGKYAFAGVARKDDCGVVAAGCTNVELSGGGTVNLRLTDADGPGAACTAGTVCREARCIPSTDVRDPNVGADCSLELLGSGPLPNALSDSGVVLSAPAIVAAGDGFLIAYREYAASIGVSRLTLLPLDAGGGTLAASTEQLAGRCSTSEEADGAGLSWNGTKGLAAVSRAPCGTGAAGLDLFEVNALGVTQQKQSASLPGVQSFQISPAKGVASVAGTDTFLVAGVRDGTATIYPASNLSLGAALDFGGAPPHTGALVAGSDKAQAFVAGASASAPPPPTDGGTDGGGGASLTGQSIQRVQLAAAGSDLGNLPVATDVGGTWASLATQATRAVVVSDGASVGRPMAYQLFDLGRGASTAEGYAPESAGKVLFSDVALQGDHLFFFLEQQGALSLVAYDKATTTPTLKREVFLARDPRVPSLDFVRDGLVAVAANDTRVAVVWMTARRMVTDQTGGSDAVSLRQSRLGGYAVFACR